MPTELRVYFPTLHKMFVTLVALQPTDRLTAKLNAQHSTHAALHTLNNIQHGFALHMPI